ncbi:hypothetical protein BGZ94_001134 [Podila epigama]|nr:hypothetical protein BGZ94_001134 [Podila epigama]
MFNTLLKKASESSFAAMASETLDSRPGSPAAQRRPPGSPLNNQQTGHGSLPTRKPTRNNRQGTGAINPHSSNAQLASQLDEAYNDIESFQKLLQKAAQEKLEANMDLLREEKDSLSEELFEARELIKTMRTAIESKAADDFLSPKSKSEDGGTGTMEKVKPAGVPSSTLTTADPLGITMISSQDPEAQEKDGVLPPKLSKRTESTGDATAVIKETSAKDEETAHKIQTLASKLSEATEKCKELEATLTVRTNELAKQKSDHEEKMKKMKAIFAAANKNLNEYRQSIAAKDEEISSLKARLETEPQQGEATAEQIQAISDLEAELKNQSELAASKLAQMESKYKQANVQLEKIRVEYQQYKQRASALLQQQRDSQPKDDDSKLNELQKKKKKLLRNRSLTVDLQEVELKKSAIENELLLALDQISSLESGQEIHRRQERQHTRQLKDLERSLKDAQRERESLEARIASMQELRDMEAQSLMRELGGTTKDIEEKLAKKEEENAELHRILDRSNDDITAARQEIQTLKDLIKTMEAQGETSAAASLAAAATASATASASASATMSTEDQGIKGYGQLSISTGHGSRSTFSPQDVDSPISRASSSLSLPLERPAVYSTLSDLLAAKPLVERSPFSETSGNGVVASQGLTSVKEKEYQIKLQHLTDLLNESEENHQKLLDQAKVLKEEIRNLDRAEKRQNLSVDYLKNIVLKYLEAPDRERLLPVLTTVLQLSPAEVASLKKKTIQQPSVPAMVLNGFFGSSS